MLIPYSTDAPVYHFPFVTIGLVLINIAVFAVTMTSLEEFRFLMLEFDTINPLQWLTTNFMHAGIMHLVGNMFFLWGFGLVVEGKLGALRFAGLYLGMAVVYGALVQLIMFTLFANDECALGASGVIFSLLGIAVLWAPKNDMNCLLLMGMFTRPLSLSILWFGGFYIFMQIAFFILGGFSMSSEALHIAGLIVGFPVGAVLLKRELVDCEGWDYFTLYHATYEEQKFRQSKRRRDRQAAKVKEARSEESGKLRRLDQSLTDAIESGNPKVAVAMYFKFANRFDEGERLSGRAAMGLVSALQQEGEWEATIPVIARMLKKYPVAKTTSLRLNLAQVLIKRTNQPKQAIAVLRKISREALTQPQISAFNNLAKEAKKKVAEGSFEGDIYDW